MAVAIGRATGWAIRAAMGLLWIHALVPHPVFGAEWAIEPTATVKGEYNDNLLLTPLSHDAVWGAWMSPAMKLSGSTEALRVATSAKADFVTYRGSNTDQKLTNLYFPVKLSYQTDRTTWGLDGTFTRDNTLMGELVQTGAVLDFAQRNYANAHPTVLYALTERLSLQSGYQYTHVTYDNIGRASLIDYDTHSGDLGLLYRLSERDQVQLSGYYLSFKAPAVSLTATVNGGQATYVHEFADQVTLMLSGGLRHVVTQVKAVTGTIRDPQTVPVFSASVEKRYETGALRLSVSREVNPSGIGLLLTTHNASLTMTKNMTENWSLSLTTLGYIVDSVSEGQSVRPFSSQTLVRVTPATTWKLSEQWSLTGSYSRTMRTIDLGASTLQADANAVMLSLTYATPKISWAR